MTRAPEKESRNSEEIFTESFCAPLGQAKSPLGKNIVCYSLPCQSVIRRKFGVHSIHIRYTLEAHPPMRHKLHRLTRRVMGLPDRGCPACFGLQHTSILRRPWHPIWKQRHCMMTVLTLNNLIMYIVGNTNPKQVFNCPRIAKRGTYQVLTHNACSPCLSCGAHCAPCSKRRALCQQHRHNHHALGSRPGSFWECMAAADAWPGHC